MQGTLAALAILVTCAESQLTGGTVEPGKACLTPSGKEGECVNIRQCPELLQMLLRHKELGVTDYLRRSQCGTVNRGILVCCPQRNTSAPNEQYISGRTGGTIEPGKACLTPSGKGGECVNIRQCPELLLMLILHKELGFTEYLRRSQCVTANRGILVCCPPWNTSAPNEQYISGSTGGTVEPGKACLTPSGEGGVCVIIMQCPELLLMLVLHKELGFTDYLRRFQCGSVNRGILVCCPQWITSAPNEQYISGSTEEQKTEKPLNTQALPYDVCGQSDIFRPKLDGAKVSLGAYPWMAALGSTENGSTYIKWLCSGSLITDQYVMTVVQCARSKLTHVRLGDLDLNDAVDDGASPVDIEVETFVTHPDPLLSGANDIALVKMKTKVQFDYTKKPICLPPPGFYVTSFAGYTGALIGWGTFDSSKATITLQHPLQEASLTIEDSETCKAHYNTSIIDERIFCAGDHGRDVACFGDGGAPLMMYRRYKGQDRMFLLGMVSFGRVLCGLNSTSPGGYTNVSTFYHWIVSHLDL